MQVNLVGLDIGGTKCAVSYGVQHGGELDIRDEVKFETIDREGTLGLIFQHLADMLQRHELTAANVKAIGISCGGPLNVLTGTIQAPPNLPNWDHVPIVKLVENRFGIRAVLQNDANASALAEWRFGAGRGTNHMAYLTFGTGLGAGLILNGQVYDGANGNAGELGHIRLSDHGPVGYGKSGSFEGFCSGSGIAQIARTMVTEKWQQGEAVGWCNHGDLDGITARRVAREAHRGDALALSVLQTSAIYLGKGLAILIDLLNPELIVLGGIYTRNSDLMEPWMLEIVRKEVLPRAGGVCHIKPSLLKERIGDYAALSVAANFEG